TSLKAIAGPVTREASPQNASSSTPSTAITSLSVAPFGPDYNIDNLLSRNTERPKTASHVIMTRTCEPRIEEANIFRIQGSDFTVRYCRGPMFPIKAGPGEYSIQSLLHRRGQEIGSDELAASWDSYNAPYRRHTNVGDSLESDRSRH